MIGCPHNNNKNGAALRAVRVCLRPILLSHLVTDHSLGAEGPRQSPPYGPTLEKFRRAGVSYASLSMM